MKRLFLTSSSSSVTRDMSKHLKAKGQRLMFVKTASEVEGDDLWWLDADRKALEDVGFQITDYTFTSKTREEIEEDLSDFDVLFVSGGNTFYLLEKIQQSGCAKIIKKFVDDGKIYIGSSAGSLVAGPDISSALGLDDEKMAPSLKGYEGLGLVDFVVIPHWGSDHFKERQLEKEQMENLYGIKDKLILLNDNQYVKVEGDNYQIIDTAQSSKQI